MGILARNTSDDAFDVTRTADADAIARPARSASGSGVRLAAPLQLRDAARYELLGEHGRGGLGRVLRAHDNELGRDIAIKELLERNHNAEVRFFREALITARLEHPNIVPVHEAGRWADGTPFYAMKLVSGRPLKQLVEAAQSTGDRLALLHNVIAVADAIAYAHDNRVIHRDLKPSNVLVGNFGETVVIDWGLAKVLDEPETITDAPYRKPAREELTATGTMLGTPAYMAPEQAIGTSNERTDIYALGGMLCEVLTGKLPNTCPTYPPGTPRDLIAIVERAMARDPEQRYARALDLADDLRRFARRERVSARRYSLPARFALGVARHKTFAVMLGAGLVALTITLGISLAKITDQRTEAVVARNEADLARRTAESAKDALTLKHVELLMHTDPTAALAALGDYHGLDETRRRQLEAEARGRGVAREVTTPHTRAIYFTTTAPDGSIVSIAEDSRITRTVGKTTSTLADDVASNLHWAYAAQTGRLAYATVPAGVAYLDVRTGLRTTVTTAGAPLSLALSEDGSQLAELDTDGALRVWQLRPTITAVQQRVVHDPIAVAFAGRRVVAWHMGGLVALDTIDSGASAATFAQPTFEVDVFEQRRLAADEHYVAVGGSDGNVTVFTPDLRRLGSVAACHGGVHGVRVLTTADRVGFGCKSGGGGIAHYDPATRTISIEKRFTLPDPIIAFEIAADGSLAVASSEATVFVHDLRSGLTSRRDGHDIAVTALGLPTPKSNAIISADANGELRTWAPPTQSAHVAAELATTIVQAAFAPDGKSLAASGTDGTLRIIQLDTGAVSQLDGHTGFVELAIYSPDGRTMATASVDGTARVWRRSDGKCLRVFDGHHSIVQDIDYLDDGHLVSAGNDGAIRSWSIAGTDDTLVFHSANPLQVMYLLKPTGSLVAQDTRGTVWVVGRDGNTRRLRGGEADPVALVRSSPDDRFMAVGTEHGALSIYRTSDWSVVKTDVLPELSNVRFDPSGHEALLIGRGHIHATTLGGDRLPWHDLGLVPLDARYTPDGTTIAFTMPDGGVWLFDDVHDRWAYFRDHLHDQRRSTFSPDGKWIATTDGAGSVVVRDVAATFADAERND